jgi:hypothetical protein
MMLLLIRPLLPLFESLPLSIPVLLLCHDMISPDLITTPKVSVMYFRQNYP